MSDSGVVLILAFALICVVVGGIATLLMKDWRPYIVAGAIAILFAIVVSFVSG